MEFSVFEPSVTLNVLHSTDPLTTLCGDVEFTLSSDKANVASLSQNNDTITLSSSDKADVVDSSGIDTFGIGLQVNFVNYPDRLD